MEPQRKFEVHLAGPNVEGIDPSKIFGDLEKIGLTKNKYFLGVYNVPVDLGYSFVGGTPPTGHDLDNPLWMSTAKTGSYDQVKKLVRDGMDVLESYGISGNFEVEQIIGPNVSDFSIDLENDFPGYSAVDDSPKFENHIVWKNSLDRLPSYEDICSITSGLFGYAPHQIVDFSRDISGKELVSRVATFYQPDRKSTLDFQEKFNDLRGFAGSKYSVAEQVCLVGE